jgi:hypothetical protein
MLGRVAIVRTNISEQCIASIIGVKTIGVLGKLAATSNRSISSQRASVASYY